MVETGVPAVLVVEDDEAVRGFLTYALESGGHPALGVRTGEEAMAVLRESSAAVILIDGILPDMHGIRLARAILDDPAFERVAITFVTGAIRDGRAPVAGVGALSKPLRARDLVEAVEALLCWRDAGGSRAVDRQAALAELEHIFLVGA
ncbi:MAG: response regulator [Candidatus Dormibacteria bacterium]